MEKNTESHDPMCPYVSDQSRSCACELIYLILVEEDLKKSECMQVAYEAGREEEKSSAIIKISGYRNVFLKKLYEIVESSQHHGEMLLYSGIIEALNSCIAIIEQEDY
jgi:flagellin-specific chaperone FliS